MKKYMPNTEIAVWGLSKPAQSVSQDERYTIVYGVDEDSGEYFIEDCNGRIAEGLDFAHARLFANAPFLLSIIRGYMNSYPLESRTERVRELLEEEGLL